MTNSQAFFLGAMAAWTPSLLVLAWLLRRPFVDYIDQGAVSSELE
jgi:hypothetical protein